MRFAEVCGVWWLLCVCVERWREIVCERETERCRRGEEEGEEEG